MSAPLAMVVDEVARALPRAGANALASALERLRPSGARGSLAGAGCGPVRARAAPGRQAV
ncbi:MAG: hypothetical protein ACRD0K_09095 [Egibacteraceae bacterium]